MPCDKQRSTSKGTLFSYLSFTKSNLQDILHPYFTCLAVFESWQMGALCIMCLCVRLAWGGIRLQCLSPTQPKDGCKSCLESRKILLFELNSEWNMKLVRHVLSSPPRDPIQSIPLIALMLHEMALFFKLSESNVNSHCKTLIFGTKRQIRSFGVLWKQMITIFMSFWKLITT